MTAVSVISAMSPISTAPAVAGPNSATEEGL